MKTIILLLLVGAAVPALSAVRGDDSLECEACKIVIKAVEKWVASNKTESEIETLLVRVCSILPTKSRHECKKIVDVGVKELIAALESYETPERVCALHLHMCKDVVPPATAECEVCKFVVHDFEGWIEDGKTVREMEALVENLCKVMPGATWKKVCDVIVDKGVQGMIELIIEHGDPTAVCRDIKLCTQAAPKPKPVAVKDTIECQVCKVVVRAVEKWVAENKTETEITMLLDRLCRVLPGRSKATCLALAGAGVKDLIWALEEYESPERVCDYVKMCNDPIPPNDLECEACKFMIQSVLGWLEEGKTQGEIEKAVEEVCRIMPKDSYKKICDTIVDVGVLELIAMIEKLETPDKVCAELKMCKPKALPKPKPVGAGPLECEACKVVVRAVEKWVASNKTEGEITVLLDRLCRILPARAKATCFALAGAGVKDLIWALEEYESPERVCDYVKMCNDPIPPVNVECEACHFVVHDILGWLEEGKTQGEIEQLVEQLCEVMPKATYKKMCDTIADVGVLELIAMIEKYETPEKVCAQLKMCPALKKPKW